IAAALVLAASLATAIAADKRPGAADAHESAESTVTLVDASGRRVPRKTYRRIASGSGVADRLLLDLAEPDRIVAPTRYGARHSPLGHRYAGKALIESLADVESIVALAPDLLLVNDYDDRARAARLREAGIVVFDLGDMQGLVTLLPNIAQVAALVGD